MKRATNGRTNLTSRLRATLAAHAEADRTGVDVAEILGRGVPRRRLLSAALAAPMLVPTVAVGGRDPSVLIVGAGLAGVRAAHWLYKVKGVRSTIYEGSTRAGGRCYSLRGFFDDGIVVEHGGALINTDHTLVRNLANSLHLSLYESNGGNQEPGGDRYWIDGVDYPYDSANDDWGQVWRAMRDALRDAPYCQTYAYHTTAGQQLDHMTVDEWLEANVPGGLGSRFAKLMRSNAIAEYGLDPDEQSALNLIYLLGWNVQNSLDPLNGADERFSIAGGNDQLISSMLAELPAGTVTYDRRLVAVRTNSNASVTCTFQSGNSYMDVTADKVVLALPFTTLRECDLSSAGFSARKLTAINHLSLGANSKLHVQFGNRPWVEHGYGGATYTSMDGFQCAWDDTAGRPGSKGVMCFFPGGDQVLRTWTGAAFGPAPAQQVNAYLNQLEPIFPGARAAYSGKAYRDAWALNPWSHGAYTCQRPGQYTSFFGVEGEPEGNVHFAGEHTSVEFFGYLNGAVESGERVGREIAG